MVFFQDHVFVIMFKLDLRLHSSPYFCVVPVKVIEFKTFKNYVTFHFSPTIKAVVMEPDQVAYNSLNEERLFFNLLEFH